MSYFNIFEGQPLTRRCSVKAAKRLSYRAYKLGAQFNEQEQREKIPYEVAWECDDEDLLRLLEEHPRWLITAPAILADDFLTNQLTVASLLRRMLVDLLALQMEIDWYKRRRKMYEPDSFPWTTELREAYDFLKADPGRLHHPHDIDVLQLIAGKLTLETLIRTMRACP